MLYRARFLIPILLTVVLALPGCSSDSGTDPDPGPTGSAEIGPAGGTVVSSDGKVEVTVPAGALATTETITVEPLAVGSLPAAFDGLAVGAAYELGPDGLTFAQPVELEFTSEQTPRQTDGSISVYFEAIFTQDETGALEKLEGTTMSADAVDNTFRIEATTTHFSRFARGVDKSSTTSPVAVVTAEMFVDTEAEQLPDLLPTQFSTTTRLRGDFSGSYATLPVSMSNLTDAGSATPLGSGTRFWTASDFEGTNEVSRQVGFQCEKVGDIDVRVRLNFDSSFTGSDELRLRIRTICPEDTGTGGGDPVRIATPVGPELAQTFQFASHTWDDRDEGEFDYALIGGTNGSGIYDLNSGQLRYSLGVGNFYGVVAVEKPGTDADYSSGFASYGPSGGSFIEWDSATGFDHFSQLFEFQNSIWDAVAYNDDETSGGFSYVSNRFQARFLQYDEENSLTNVGPGIFASQLDGGQGGEFVGVLRTTFSFKDSQKTPGDVLLVTAGGEGPGRVYVGDFANQSASLTSVTNVGTDPRRVRYRNGIAAVSNFGSDDLTILSWEGTSVTATEQSVPVGDGPVGIDLIDVPGGNIAICSTGYLDNTYSITVVDSSGELVSNDKFTVPDNGQAPGHATWTQRGTEYWVLISCNGSNEVIPVAVEF
jgi:hypothetical protein